MGVIGWFVSGAGLALMFVTGWWPGISGVGNIPGILSGSALMISGTIVVLIDKVNLLIQVSSLTPHQRALGIQIAEANLYTIRNHTYSNGNLAEFKDLDEAVKTAEELKKP